MVTFNGYNDRLRWYNKENIETMKRLHYIKGE